MATHQLETLCGRGDRMVPADGRIRSLLCIVVSDTHYPTPPMVESTSHTITRLLENLVHGDKESLDVLFPLVYEQLKQIARRERRRWRGNNTVDTIALVSEAYEKMVDRSSIRLENRAHFFAVAAKAMRHMLVDYAKSRLAAKRGGKLQRIDLDDASWTVSDSHVLELIALDEALKRLEKINKRQSQVVECRFFAGMTIEEASSVIGIAKATANRDWETAKIWLFRELHDDRVQ